MKTLSVLSIAVLVALSGITPARAAYPGRTGFNRGFTGFNRGFTGYRSFNYGGYGVPAYSYAPSYGYAPSYYPSYAPSYSYAPAYTPSYSYVLPQPQIVVQQAPVVLQSTPVVAQQAPVTVQAPVPTYAPPVAQEAPAPLPPPMPQAAPVYAPPAPVYAPPTSGVCAQELQQGYLSAPTISYLGTLPVYDRYAFLHQHYRHGFADRQFTRHFGTIPGTFRNRFQGLAPRTGGGRHR